MQNIVKYSYFAREIMELILEALKNCHFCLRAASRDSHLNKDRRTVTWLDKISGCFSASVSN
jgi:hypothetical protein